MTETLKPARCETREPKGDANDPLLDLAIRALSRSTLKPNLFDRQTPLEEVGDLNSVKGLKGQFAIDNQYGTIGTYPDDYDYRGKGTPPDWRVVDNSKRSGQKALPREQRRQSFRYSFMQED